MRRMIPRVTLCCTPVEMTKLSLTHYSYGTVLYVYNVFSLFDDLSPYLPLQIYQ